VLQAFLPYLRIRRRILKSRFRGIFECISAENTLKGRSQNPFYERLKIDT
jgi:hypothetical protein